MIDGKVRTLRIKTIGKHNKLLRRATAILWPTSKGPSVKEEKFKVDSIFSFSKTIDFPKDWGRATLWPSITNTIRTHD